MKKEFTRRDFLKLSRVLPFTIIAPRFLNSLGNDYQQQNKLPNVIVFVLDAFSAFDISLYGYQRETTPNIARLAERAVVYHNHYSGGNFTTPGTASLLSGMLPWKHRHTKGWFTMSLTMIKQIAQAIIDASYEGKEEKINELVHSLKKKVLEERKKYV